MLSGLYTMSLIVRSVIDLLSLGLSSSLHKKPARRSCSLRRSKSGNHIALYGLLVNDPLCSFLFKEDIHFITFFDI